jgi:hypothetical protein
VIIDEAARRGYAIGDGLRTAAAAQRLDDEGLLYEACDGGRWDDNYWGEMKRRWTHERACQFFREGQRGGWISEDAPPPPSRWWKA